MMKCTKWKKEIDNSSNDDLCRCKTKFVERISPDPVKIYILTPIPNLIMRYSGMKKTLDVFGHTVYYF
jgi:hypothetical protein